MHAGPTAFAFGSFELRRRQIEQTAFEQQFHLHQSVVKLSLVFLKSFGCNLDGVFAGIVNAKREAAIYAKTYDPQHLHSKRPIIKPTLLMLAGLMGICIGWWRLKFCRFGVDLLIGIPLVIVGVPLISYGFGILVGIF